MEKRVFFFANFWPNDPSRGVTKKVFSQIRTLVDMGFDVTYTAYLDNGFAIFDKNHRILAFKESNTFLKLISRHTRNWFLKSFSAHFIEKHSFKFDYAYLRYLFFDPLFLSLVKTLKEKGTKNIIEAHSYPTKKLGFSVYSPIYFIDSLYSREIHHYVDLVAGISNHDNIWGIKTVSIDNGINLEAIKIRQPSFSEDRKMRIISVAYEWEIHGYDRFLRGLHEYYYLKNGQADIEVFLVGKFMTSTIKMIKKLNLENRVFLLGQKFGSELDAIYDHCNLAIGPLAPHRVGSTLGASLKNKEYFAKGIPFFFAGKEILFDDSYPYAKSFPIGEDPIDISKIVDFYNCLKKDPNVIVNMRRFAEEHYTWEKQFNKLFEEVYKLP